MNITNVGKKSELEPLQDEGNEVKRRISVEVFRHGPKAKRTIEGHDALVPLTPGGLEHAFEAATKLGVNNPVRIVASTRKRVIQTALLIWANVAKITKEVALKKTVDELSDLANKALNKGQNTTRRMMVTDDRLNFDYESHDSFSDSFYKAYEQLQENKTLDWQLEQSDQLVLDLAKKEPNEGLLKVSTYTRFAGDMAEMINRYVRAMDKLKVLKKNEDFDFDILMGSHSQNLECFLMRLIEIKEGRPALEEFFKTVKKSKRVCGI